MRLKKYIYENPRLGLLCQDIEYGITASAADIGNVILLRITDINENGKLNLGLKYYTIEHQAAQRYILNYNDVLIARSGATAGKPYIHKTAGKFIFGSYLLRVRLKKEKIDPDYFFVFLNSSNYYQQLSGIKVGSAQPNVNTTNLRTLIVPLPSLEEQKQIASLFQSIETAIEQVEIQEKNLLNLQNTLINVLLRRNPQFGNLLNEGNTTIKKFGEVADCIENHEKERNGITRFIGLENIESGNFTIENWGDISAGTTFTKRFNEGDVLFGKRRSYLKKVAVADFDGICSGDILVFRAKEKEMLAGLLPYYVSSEAFIQHAVTTSAGSLSPRTKWKDLRDFEFSIPDLKTQSLILEVLSQIQLLIKQFKKQNKTLRTLKQNLLNEMLG